MNQLKSKVDVIITCYNKQDTIERAIKSVKYQTLKEFFCVVVDDGSTDNSWDVINSAIEDDERFIAVRLKNSGVANARNTGISYGHSQFITCLDGDDGLYPEFLETCYNGIKQDRNLGIVYTEVLLHHPDSNFTIADWTKPDHNKQFDGKNQIPCCNMFRRDVFERVGGYKQRYAPKGAGAEDAELWLRFFKYGYKAKKVTEEPLFIYNAFGGLTQNIQYSEVNWTNWHTTQPLASLQTPENGIAHIVKEYDEPEISVIIPVCKQHLHLLSDALDSIEAQTFENWECIVVFDVEDSALDLPESEYYEKAYPHVKFIYTSGNMGAGAARNIGTIASKGKYITYLDADDYLQPRFLELTLSALEHFHADWIYTDIYVQTSVPESEYTKIKSMLDNGNIYCEEIKRRDGVVEYVTTHQNHEWDIDRLHLRGLASVTALYQRGDFDLVGGFDENNNREDWDFHLRLAKHGKCGLKLPLPLLTYRHNTGIRRDYIIETDSQEERKQLKRQDTVRLHETYNKKELEMACTSCKKNRIDLVKPAADSDLETLVYTGKITGGSIKGPITGRMYAINRTNDKFVIYKVHPQDAQALIDKGLFKPQQVEKKRREIIVSPTPVKVEVKELSHGDRLKNSMEVAEKAREEARRQMEIELGFVEQPQEQEVEQPEEETAIAVTWYENPEDFTIAQIKEIFENYKVYDDEIETCIDCEREGKNRATLIKFLKSQL